MKSSLQTGQSIIDVANSAGTTVSNLLTQMEQKALAASDSSLDTASRAALNTDFVALRNQITSTVQNAEFNGVNLLDGSADQDLFAGQRPGHLGADHDGPEPDAGRLDRQPLVDGDDQHGHGRQSVLTTVETLAGRVDNALATLGTSSKALDTHLNFVSNLQDTLTTGIGNLVNADLAKESATLQALQTKQQLGIQALSIANSASRPCWASSGKLRRPAGGRGSRPRPPAKLSGGDGLAASPPLSFRRAADPNVAPRARPALQTLPRHSASRAVKRARRPATSAAGALRPGKYCRGRLTNGRLIQ